MDESTVHPVADLLEAGQSMDSPALSSNGHLDGSNVSTVHLSVQQAADHARLSTKTVRRMIRRGQLRAELVDGAYVIDPDTLDQAVTLGSSGQSMDRLPVSPPGRLDLSNVQMLLEAATRPLVERLASQAEEIGRLRAELEEAQTRIRVLEPPKEPTCLEIARGSSTDGLSADIGPAEASTAKQRAWWAFWRV